MRRIILWAFLLFCVRSCMGQEPRWAASFADQGREVLRGAVGRRVPKGVVVYQASVCSGNEAVALDEGVILKELNARGLVVFSGNSLDALLVRVRARSLGALSADVGEAVTLGGAVITGSGVIRMADRDRQKWSFGLSLGAALFYWLRGKLDGATLDPQKVNGFKLPDPVNLPARQSCWKGNVLGLPIAGGSITFSVQ